MFKGLRPHIEIKENVEGQKNQGTVRVRKPNMAWIILGSLSKRKTPHDTLRFTYILRCYISKALHLPLQVSPEIFDRP
jgi:hypothetical protein